MKKSERHYHTNMIVAGRTDGWLKNVAPSDILYHWFGHDPAKWNEFQGRYFVKLGGNPRCNTANRLRQPVTAMSICAIALKTPNKTMSAALKEYLSKRLQPIP
ncbi:MAG: DUF488 family protein [Syntrophobacteraceae bacterium]